MVPSNSLAKRSKSGLLKAVLLIGFWRVEPLLFDAKSMELNPNDIQYGGGLPIAGLRYYCPGATC